MPTVLILVVFVAVVLVLVLLVIVVVAIRQEPRETEMRTVAPSPIAVVVRRLLGVYLRRPDPPADSQKEWPTTAWTETTSRPSGGRR
jgi:NADH:ubiquinone oxidoreductase subunit 6 (subunit J)